MAHGKYHEQGGYRRSFVGRIGWDQMESNVGTKPEHKSRG
jgi:hypothetical protein